MNFRIDKSGTVLSVPHTDGVDFTDSFNSSQNISILEQQLKEQKKQNRKVFILSIITGCASLATLIITIIKS